LDKDRVGFPSFIVIVFVFGTHCLHVDTPIYPCSENTAYKRLPDIGLAPYSNASFPVSTTWLTLLEVAAFAALA
jgi:hypothetical protein